MKTRISMDGNAEMFCRSNEAGGACVVRAASDVLFQSEALAGIRIGLGQRTH